MSITTSYFASKAPKDQKVCIALKPNSFMPKLPKVPEFAPSNPWAEDWQQSYRNDLETRFPTPQSLQDVLDAICIQVQNPVLCCYEKDRTTCHRHILSEYIKEKLDITVQEWQGE